ncbi:MAG: 3-hydroxybutyryl-CoA dehydrogenase [Deltaproteobacteria bacterium]|nr:3-hydroxybutyryl-CoA dehydrogenase [Deltaproteobacteria bacterium]
MAIKTVGVVGCGLMGAGIAQVCAQAGYETVVREIEQGILDAGLRRIAQGLAREVERGRLKPEDRAATLGRLRGTLELEELGGADLVIEAAVEEIQVKRELFAALDRLCAPSAVLASNTSSLCILEMAVATGRPDRVLGLHFFNPPPVMKLVEVVRTIVTSAEVFEQVMGFARALGKVPVVAKDTPGFIVNLLLIPSLLDAIRAVEEGVATIADIDQAMRLGCGHPMGPLTLADFVGLDTTYRIANILYDEYRHPRYAAPPLLRRMVLAGHLGRKSGQGFYDYRGPEPVPAELVR